MFPVLIMTYIRLPNPSIAADISTPFYYTEIGSSLFFICVHMCTDMCFCVFLFTTHLAPPVSDLSLSLTGKTTLQSLQCNRKTDIRQCTGNSKGKRQRLRSKETKWSYFIMSLKDCRVFFFSCFFSVFVLFAIILFLSSSLWILRAALNPWTWIRT